MNDRRKRAAARKRKRLPAGSPRRRVGWRRRLAASVGFWTTLSLASLVPFVLLGRAFDGFWDWVVAIVLGVIGVASLTVLWTAGLRGPDAVRLRRWGAVACFSVLPVLMVLYSAGFVASQWNVRQVDMVVAWMNEHRYRGTTDHYIYDVAGHRYGVTSGTYGHLAVGDHVRCGVRVFPVLDSQIGRCR